MNFNIGDTIGYVLKKGDKYDKKIILGLLNNFSFKDECKNNFIVGLNNQIKNITSYKINNSYTITNKTHNINLQKILLTEKAYKVKE
jgi:hypothetical protein